MKKIRFAAPFFVLCLLTACNFAGMSPFNNYVGDWKWELTAHEIDGGGAVGSGTISVQDVGGNGSYSGAWSDCEGQCSVDATGVADVFVNNGFITVVLEGQPSLAKPVYKGWMRASYMEPVDSNTYEGIAEFGICTTETECYSSSQIRLTKVSSTPTYSVR